MSDQSPRGWAAIDYLRFACALLVVAHHFGAALPNHPNPAAAGALAGAALPTQFAPWTAFGWVGVEIFFVISGYVIAASAEGAGPAAFLRRRAQRLLPAAWVSASLSFAALGVVQALPFTTLAGQWLRSIAFAPMGQVIDPSYWTLGIEAAFYLMIAAQLRGGGSSVRLVRFACVIGSASAVFWIAQLGSLDGSRMSERLLQLLLLVHGVFFAIGVLLHAIHRDGLTRLRAVALVLFLAAAMLEIVGHTRDMALGLHLSANPSAPILIFMGGVTVVALCRRVQPWLGWPRGHAATLGLMTYPLYLLHQQIGAVCAGLFARAGLPAWLGLVAALPLLLWLSWAVVRFAEPPLRGLIGRALSARHGLLPDIRPSASPSGG